MKKKKESFFWTSYSDLMTSLFFVMLVLFVLVIVLLHKRMEATEQQLEEIKKVALSTEELNHSDYFAYRKDYKKYVLKIQVRYPKGESDLNALIADDSAAQLRDLASAGSEIESFLSKHKDNQYVLIIEGQASRDAFNRNYELSYERALSLMKYWTETCGIRFGDNCEILISGSGDGRLDTHSMRESDEAANQRFLIHILPKNIMESNEEQK